MAKIKYVGPSHAVDISFPGGGSVHAPKNEPVEVPDSLADSLLKQDIFIAAKAVTKEND